MEAALNRLRGFTIAEVLLALGLVTVAVLALLGLSLRSLQANRKVNDTLSGQLVADQAVERIVYQAESSASDPVWSHAVPAPYQSTTVTQGDSVFNVTVYATDVNDTGGGFIAGKRLKLLEAEVTWQDAPNGKAGQGRLQVRTSRLVHEP